MDRKENPLLGRVVAKFGSIAKFANHWGVSYAKAYRIITGSQICNENDMRDIIKALDIHDADDIVTLFSLT